LNNDLERSDEVSLGSLKDVLQEQIEDLYSAETQLVEALPKMSAAASSDALKEAIDNHLTETKGHVQRLEEILGQLGISPSAHCKGMEGLIAEGDEIIGESGDPDAKDAALIAAAQRVEHYEIAGYGTARTLAKELGHDNAVDLLDQTLDEEANADKLLTKIATGGMFGAGINQQATTRT
jgi:ferritin-like metal-binding protein YciE